MSSSSSQSGGQKRGGRRKPGVKRRSLGKEIREEEDPQWRVWFTEVERRKKALSNPKGKFIRVDYLKDGGWNRVERCKSVPVPVKTFLKSNKNKAGASLNTDLLLITSCWKKAVGDDIGECSEVYSFKNGVLTINVFSSSLLQEIRQFHSEAIIQDLRDIWTASQPLVKVVYRLGKR